MISVGHLSCYNNNDVIMTSLLSLYQHGWKIYRNKYYETQVCTYIVWLKFKILTKYEFLAIDQSFPNQIFLLTIANVMLATVCQYFSSSFSQFQLINIFPHHKFAPYTIECQLHVLITYYMMKVLTCGLLLTLTL